MPYGRLQIYVGGRVVRPDVNQVALGLPTRVRLRARGSPEATDGRVRGNARRVLFSAGYKSRRTDLIVQRLAAVASGLCLLGGIGQIRGRSRRFIAVFVWAPCAGGVALEWVAEARSVLPKDVDDPHARKEIGQNVQQHDQP